MSDLVWFLEKSTLNPDLPYNITGYFISGFYCIRKVVFCVLRSGTSATGFVAERMPHSSDLEEVIMIRITKICDSSIP